MPSVSDKQQNFFKWVQSVQNGTAKKKDAPKSVLDAAKSMTKKQVSDFADHLSVKKKRKQVKEKHYIDRNIKLKTMTKIMRIDEFVATNFGHKLNESNSEGEIGLWSFPGTYGTLWGDLEDIELIDSNEFENMFGHLPEHANFDEWKVNLDTFKKELGEFYTTEIEKRYREVFGNTFKLEFSEFWSPREYNFRNDVIYAKLIVGNNGEFESALVEKMNEHSDVIAKVINDRHSSRSGFASLMSNDFNEWIVKINEFDTQYIGYAMYYAYCADTIGNDVEKWNELDLDIYELANGNGLTMDGFCEPTTDEAKREYQMYLDKR